MRMGRGSRRRRWERSWEETAPKSVRDLATGVGLPLPTHYEGRTLDGYVEKPEDILAEPSSETEPAATEPGEETP